MQTQPLTWPTFFLQLLQYLGPAVIALAATYITLRRQRKQKQDELAMSSSLRARELIFNYIKRNSIDLLTCLKLYSGVRSGATSEPGARAPYSPP